MFFDALFVDTLRGDDSTGMIYIENDSSFGIMKTAESAATAAAVMQASDHVKTMWGSGKAYIGHNRKKTVGAVSDETAHPFVVDGKFAMVHNGTLNFHKELADTVVDSEALTIHLSKVLNKDYTKEKLEEALGKVRGAYAIAAFNQDTNKIYLTRNAERPLAIIELDDCYLWGSEGAMIWWLAARQNYNLKDRQVIFIPENQLVTIDLETNKMEREDYVPKKATPPITSKVTGGTHTQGSRTGTTTTTTPSRLSKSEFKRIKKRFLGRGCLTYITDYVEKYFPKTIEEGENEVILLGDSDTFAFPHTIHAEYDIYDVPPGPDKGLTDLYYAGRISDMSYDMAAGHVLITLSQTRQIPRSTLKDTHEEAATCNTLH